MGKLFGTDGIRGVAGEMLSGELAFRVGQAAARVFTETERRKASFCIGKDTRVSSDMLEAALVAGVTSVGADAVMLGTVPTPAVAYLTAHTADAGIMISASHNPFEHNGIKIFNAQGYKLSDALEEEMEEMILSDRPCPQETFEHIGRIRRDEMLVERYIAHLMDVVEGDLSGLRVAIDCANGAAVRTARGLFSRLGLRYEILFDKPDGVNINAGCGSTHLDALRERVIEGRFDLGVAFDGDADRCLAVDENGRLIDGDQIMAVCGMEEKRLGRLRHDTIVATVMSNLGFHRFARDHGLHVVSAAVGDRNVLEEMRKGGYTLGGEQSGHLIFHRHATTGDGQLTALRFLEIAARSGRRVSELLSGFAQYPQLIVNVRVRNEMKHALTGHAEVAAAIRGAEEQLAGDGRILVRPSGTEPLVRVMVEGPEDTLVQSLAESIAAVISRVSA
ncbi:MAG: phosphoglucosamine mutase [Oscillospiraceae bacterium]|jgi:phosphoglucosamine mutase|nr:phosphoglucosamine mutase [Oscillospiraceae bacterium]